MVLQVKFVSTIRNWFSELDLKTCHRCPHQVVHQSHNAGTHTSRLLRESEKLRAAVEVRHISRDLPGAVGGEVGIRPRRWSVIP